MHVCDKILELKTKGLFEKFVHFDYSVQDRFIENFELLQSEYSKKVVCNIKAID